MAKLRKILGGPDSPHIIALMGLIETQSKITIVNWCVSYAREHVLKIYENVYPEDIRLINALNAVNQWKEGKIKTAEVKKLASFVNTAAREAEKTPAAQAAARAVGQAVASIYTPTCSLGFVFYGVTAIVYDRTGLKEKEEIYEQIASEEGWKMEAALRSIAVTDEENPVKINWNC